MKKDGRNNIIQLNIPPMIPPANIPTYTEMLNTGPGSAETIENPVQN